MLTQKPSVRLELWAVVDGSNRSAYEKLQPGNLLLGKAYGHQRIDTGMFIFTSPIVRVDSEHNLVETKNTCYRLGEASADYKSWSRDHQEVAA
jgi:hypothetical protein